jgi:hypothetical protein
MFWAYTGFDLMAVSESAKLTIEWKIHQAHGVA